MRVQMIVHKGVRRAVVVLGLESQPHMGFVMAPAVYEKIRPALVQKYGEFEEVEVQATPELVAAADEVRRASLLDNIQRN